MVTINDSRVTSDLVTLNALNKVLAELDRTNHKLMFLCLGGSYAYGTNIEGSDIDIRGICLNSEDEIVGIEKDPEQFISDEGDIVIYTLKKAVKLLSECNPSMIESMFCRNEDYIYMSLPGITLLSKARIFLSQRAAKTFGGYAKSQLNRLINRSGRSRDLILENEERSFEKAFITLAQRHKSYIKNSAKVSQDGKSIHLSFAVKDATPTEVADLLNELNSIDRSYRKSVRNDKATTHGKLSKHMMHLIRLYMMGEEVLRTGYPSTYREGDEHELLMSIRNGAYLKEDRLTPTEEFQALLDKYSAKYEEAAANTGLPEVPDYAEINKLVKKLNWDYVLNC